MKAVAAELPRENRRRKYLIRTAFQCRYAVTIAALVFAVSCIMTIVLYGVLHQQARLRTMHPSIYVAEVPAVVWLSGLAFAAACALGVGLWCIIATHRVCGPIYVMEGFLRQVAAGHLPPLRPLRRKDELQDFYKVFCDAIQSLQATRQQELATLTAALRIAKQAAGADERSCREAIESVASRLETVRCRIAATLGQEPEDIPAVPAGLKRSVPAMAGVGGQ
jgi:hypothetical protein